MGNVAIPHIALPFRLGPSGANVVEQDSIDEVAQNVAVLVSTDIGSRPPLPTYGIVDPVFSQQIDTAGIITAIKTWEPRANVSIAAGVGPVAGVRINVSVTGAPPTATVPIQLLPIVAPVITVGPLGAGTYDGGNAYAFSNTLLDGGNAAGASGTVFDGGNAFTH